MHIEEQPSSVNPGTQRQLQWLSDVQVPGQEGPAGSSSLVSVRGSPCPTRGPFQVSGVTRHHQVVAARTGIINPGMRQEWPQCEAARAVRSATARNEN